MPLLAHVGERFPQTRDSSFFSEEGDITLSESDAFSSLTLNNSHPMGKPLSSYSLVSHENVYRAIMENF